MVIFFHGRALTAASVDQIADAFGSARIIVPTGGVTLRRGTTWFENESIGIAKPESVERASERFLNWYSDYFSEPVRPWLCGFSNGGAFASHLLMKHPERFRGAVLLSSPMILPPWPKGHLSGKAVFYGRGHLDQIVPHQVFLDSEHYLVNSSGAKTLAKQYEIGHEITAAERDDVAAWFETQGE